MLKYADDIFVYTALIIGNLRPFSGKSVNMKYPVEAHYMRLYIDNKGNIGCGNRILIE